MNTTGGLGIDICPLSYRICATQEEGCAQQWSSDEQVPWMSDFGLVCQYVDPRRAVYETFHEKPKRGWFFLLIAQCPGPM